MSSATSASMGGRVCEESPFTEPEFMSAARIVKEGSSSQPHLQTSLVDLLPASLIVTESLRLEWKIFQNSFYTVKPLYFRPLKPMSMCPVAHPVVAPIIVPKAPPAAEAPKVDHPLSFCRPDHWMNPLYKCHWKLLSPQQEVAKALGPKAGARFGNITLLQALAKNTSLNTVGDGHYQTIYNELLSQTVAALLNSYFSSSFGYSPLTITRQFDDVMKHGTPRDARNLSGELRKMNAGVGRGTCVLDVCKIPA